MAITKASLIDLNGNEMILDADADTTITADTDDQIDIKVGGTDLIRIDASGLGVGIVPAEILDLKAASGDTRIRLDAASGSDTEIKFFNAGAAQFTIGHDDGSDTFRIAGANVDDPHFAWGKDGSLVVTCDAGGHTVFNENSVDADFRVESDGNANMLFVDGGNNRVGIGAVPQCQFAIQDSTTPELGFYRTSGATSGLLGRITMGNTDIDSGMGGLEFNQDGATNSSRIGFFTQPSGGASTERLRIHSGGVSSFSNGIELGSGLDATAANTLDDYEEGTWTPADGSGAGLSFSFTHNRYTKVGRLVVACVRLTFPTTSSSSLAQVTLPFTADSNANASAAGGVCTEQNLNTDLTLTASINSTTKVLFRSNGATALTNAQLSGKILRFTVTYQAA